MSDSTNVLAPGRTTSEATVMDALVKKVRSQLWTCSFGSAWVLWVAVVQ